MSEEISSLKEHITEKFKNHEEIEALRPFGYVLGILEKKTLIFGGKSCINEIRTRRSTKGEFLLNEIWYEKSQFLP